MSKTRHYDTPPFQSPLLRGSELVVRMKHKYRVDNAGKQFTYDGLSVCLNLLNPDSEHTFTKNYLSTLSNRDNCPTEHKAKIIAEYLQIPLDSIAMSSYAQTPHARMASRKNAEKARKATVTKVDKQTVQRNKFHIAAAQFISKNPNLNLEKYGVSYVQ